VTRTAAFFGTLARDVRYALRMLRAQSSFALAAIVTLALGVGVNTAVFSVVNAIVLRPLPVRDGDRIVVLASQRTPGRTMRGMSFAEIEDARASSTEIFEDVAGYSVGFLGLAPVGGTADRVLVTWVTGQYFSLLDLRPFLGRLIREDEGTPGRTDSIAVLGYSTWQRRFGGDPSVVGRTVLVNRHPCTIVGVTPPGFAGTFAFSESELYLPLNWQSGDGVDRKARALHALARLRPGVGIATAQAVMEVLAGRLAREQPDSNAGVSFRVLPERFARPEEDQFRTNALGAAIVLAMVVLVMVVAAVNVTNLQLARTAARSRELAIRSALGAGRGRLVRLVMTECLVLAAVGGGAGVLLGTWAARALAAIRLPGDLPVRFDFQLDARVLAYAATLAVAAGVAAGLLSVRRSSGIDLEQILRGARQAASPHRHRIRRLLVAGQMACCVVLLSAAGLFVRSLFEAERADLGFRPEGVLNLQMDAGQLGYTESRGRALFTEIERRVRAIPGVESTSFAFTVPLGYVRVHGEVEAEGRTGRVLAGRNSVGPEYFRTLGIQIVRGRAFTGDDNEAAPRVAIVNERLADLLWPGQDPPGRRFRSPGPDERWIEVIGVARTGKYQFLFEDPQPYVYVPIAQEYAGLRVLHVRSAIAPEALAPTAERAIHALEPHLLLYDVQTMKRALGSGLGYFPIRVGATAVAAFGLLAFALAIVGVFGVTSYLSSQRTQEIGVRMAVGASREQIVRLVLGDGSRFVIAGVAAGLAATLAGSRLLGSFLFGISAYDPFTLAGVVVILTGVALIACAIPAWRAARVDPTVALRSE